MRHSEHAVWHWHVLSCSLLKLFSYKLGHMWASGTIAIYSKAFLVVYCLPRIYCSVCMRDVHHQWFLLLYTNWMYILPFVKEEISYIECSVFVSIVVFAMVSLYACSYSCSCCSKFMITFIYFVDCNNTWSIASFVCHNNTRTSINETQHFSKLHVGNW